MMLVVYLLALVTAFHLVLAAAGNVAHHLGEAGQWMALAVLAWGLETKVSARGILEVPFHRNWLILVAILVFSTAFGGGLAWSLGGGGDGAKPMDSCASQLDRLSAELARIRRECVVP